VVHTTGSSSEHKRWNERDLSAKRYIYVWADGIHLQARLEDDAQCILVIIGATPEGKKGVDRLHRRDARERARLTRLAARSEAARAVDRAGDRRRRRSASWQLKFTRLSVRPRHPQTDEAAQQAFKKTSPPAVVSIGASRLPPGGGSRKPPSLGLHLRRDPPGADRGRRHRHALGSSEAMTIHLVEIGKQLSADAPGRVVST